MTENGRKTGRRSQVERRAASEAALLDAALELFAERGVERTTLAEVGVRAGYSRGHASFVFGTKDQLVDRAAAHARDRFLREAQAQVVDEADGLGKVLNIADYYMRSVKSAPTYIRAFFAMWGGAMPSRAQPAIARYDPETRKILASLIEEGQRDGSVSTRIGAKATAVALLGLFRGIGGQLMISPDAIGERALRAECRRVVELVLTGSGRPDEERRPGSR